MVLNKEQQEKLIKKEEELVNELNKYKNIGGKIRFDIKTNYTEYIDISFENGYLWFEIPKKRKTTICSCLKDNKEWYYEKGYGIPHSYTEAELDIIANKDTLLNKLESIKKEQNALLDSILN